MKYGKYAFTCRFTSPAALPGYKGSTFRGVFGHALKRVVCALKQQTCESCVLRERCLYYQVFETGAGVDEKGRKVQPPHPFVIEPPMTGKTLFEPGEGFECTLLLFGPYTESLPYFIYAFDQMGRIGIGKRIGENCGRFEVDTVKDEKGVVFRGGAGKLERRAETLDLDPLKDAPPRPPVNRLTVALETPLRLKFNNRLQADLPFHVLVRAMLRRVSSLMAAFDGGEPALDYKGLVSLAEGIRVAQNRLSWFDWKRYSNRQQEKMLMGGMTGSVTYEGDLTAFMPLVGFCREAHLGKQTAFGLGKMMFSHW